ncbi:transketolase family protein [Candidatus Jorgensenbacteria bacterium]|nr:transketolase family protein [Candidatus Jorgensenbacteria bacterium]
MLNPDAKLNPKLFDADVEQKPTRDGYGDGLVIAGEKDPNVVALCADLTESTRSEPFAKKFPDRFFEIGVAEQNMATIAAGLGISGKIPFISSYAVFSPGRNYEQIRTTIAYNDANVKIAGAHAGISVGADGATHQATEDIAIMRVIPNMRVVVPCDWIQTKKATIVSAELKGPVYLRFGREKSPVVTTEETPFVFGETQVFWKSKKSECAIVVCGMLTYAALVAARELDSEGIGTMVINCHTIKPFDYKTIVAAAKKCGAVVTVEEHQVHGGLGGVVAETLAKHQPTPIEYIGLQDTFGESGPPPALLLKYGMGIKDIKEAVKRAIERK